MNTPRWSTLSVVCALALTGVSLADDKPAPVNVPPAVLTAMGAEGRAELDEARATLAELVEHCGKLITSKLTSDALTNSWSASVSNSSQYAGSKCVAARAELARRSKRRADGKELMRAFAEPVDATQRVLDGLFAAQGTKLAGWIVGFNRAEDSLLKIASSLPAVIAMHRQDLVRCDALIQSALAELREAKTAQALQHQLGQLRIARNLLVANEQGVARLHERIQTLLAAGAPAAVMETLVKVLQQMAWPVAGQTLFDDAELIRLRAQIGKAQQAWRGSYARAWDAAVLAAKPLKDDSLLSGLASFRGHGMGGGMRAIAAAEASVRERMRALRSAGDAAAEIRKAGQLARREREAFVREASAGALSRAIAETLPGLDAKLAPLRETDPRRHEALLAAARDLRRLVGLRKDSYERTAELIYPSKGRSWYEQQLAALAQDPAGQSGALAALVRYQDVREAAIRRARRELRQLEDTIGERLAFIEAKRAGR